MKRVVTALLLIPFFLLSSSCGRRVGRSLVTIALVAMFCFREYAELTALHGIAKPGLLRRSAGLLVLLLPGQSQPICPVV